MTNKILYAGFPNPKEAAGRKMDWEIYQATAEGRQKLINDGYTAISVYEYSHPVEKGKPAPLVFGDIWLDFDAKKDPPCGIGEKIGDIATSLIGLRKFLKIIVDDYSVDPALLNIWASGGKGFHLKIPREIVGSELGDKNLPQIYRSMLEAILRDLSNPALVDGATNSSLMGKSFSLELFCIDQNTFKGGRGQLIRLPHIQRHDGNYKVPVTYQEVMSQNEEFFLNIVKSDRNLDTAPDSDTISKNKKLEELFLQHKKIISLQGGNKRKKFEVSTLENECEFFKFCRDHAREVTEPQWFMLARILAHCGLLGKELFHEYSRRDSTRYKPDEAQAKFIHAFSFPYPTCQNVKEIFSCNRSCGVKCPVDIFSLKNAQSIQCSNYINKSDGLYFCDDPDNLLNGMKISSNIEIKASARDKFKSSWSKIAEISDMEGNRHTCLLPYTSLTNRGDEALNILLSDGLRLEPGTRAKSLLINFLMLNNPIKMALISDKNGWVGDSTEKYLPFDLGEQADGSDYLCLKTSPSKPTYTQSGTFEDWKEHIGKKCDGNPLLMLMIILGLAGPMLKIMGKAGFGIHLYGNSTDGKTTCLNVAASVNGADLATWRATDNALEGVAAAHNDNSLFLDEINQCDPDVVGATAYMLPNGKGKLRSTKSGNIKSPLEWNLLFGSAGEQTIADTINKSLKNKAMAGQEVRVININTKTENEMGVVSTLPPEFSSSNEFINYLLEVAKKYRGTAFVAFLRKIQNNPDLALSMSKNYESKFLDQFAASQLPRQKLRVLHNFSFLAGVGELAIQYGILPWKAGSAMDTMNYCFGKWAENWSGTSYEINSSVEKLLSLVRNGFYGKVGDNYPVKKERVAGKPSLFVQRSYIVPEICPSYLYEEFIKELDKSNLIARNRDGEPRTQYWGSEADKRPRGIYIIIDNVYNLDNDKEVKMEATMHPPLFNEDESGEEPIGNVF